MSELPADSLGAALRRLRKRNGLTQRQLADEVGTHVTHLSRLESGQRVEVSRGLLDRLGSALGAPGQVAAAAGRVPANAEVAISRYPEALERGALERRTLPALQRVVAAERAQRLLSQVPDGAVVGRRIEPAILCRYLRLRPTVLQAREVAPISFEGRKVNVSDPGSPGDAGALPRIRFLLAHAAAHAMEDRLECAFPRMGDGEELACGIAAQLLCPPGLLDAALRAALVSFDPEADAVTTGKLDPWSPAAGAWRPDVGRIIDAVAYRLAVPGWVAVRRMAEEALLDDEALFFTYGDHS